MGLGEGNHGKVWKEWVVDMQDHGSWSGSLAHSHQCRPNAIARWREPHRAKDNGCLECNSEQLSFCSNNNMKGRAVEFQHLPPTFNVGLSGSCSLSRLRKCVWGAGQHRWAQKSWNIQETEEAECLTAMALQSSIFLLKWWSCPFIINWIT